MSRRRAFVARRRSGQGPVVRPVRHRPTGAQAGFVPGRPVVIRMRSAAWPGNSGLRVVDKKDSQEICFVGEGEYADFVRQRHGAVDLAGEVVTVEGEVVGRHAGLENFTVGQRKGLKLAFGEPHYVVRLEAGESAWSSARANSWPAASSRPARSTGLSIRPAVRSHAR